MFEGKTYEEAINEVAKETVELVLALFDGEVNMTDFMALVESGKAWNAAIHIPGIEKKTLLAHVVAVLAGKGVGIALPLPTGTIPA